MVRLVHGRGQLGEALAAALQFMHVGTDCDIYHTWDIDDKSAESQEYELGKFIVYCNAHRDRRIVLISGIHEHFDHYLTAKLKAEVHLLDHTDNGMVIRLPYMIGKGLAQRLKDGKPFTRGAVEVSTFDAMARRVLDCITLPARFHVLHGDMVQVELLDAAIRFGGE
jgi:hypothetical protein